MSHDDRSPPTTDDRPSSSVDAQPPVGASSFLSEDETASPATPTGGGAGFETLPDAQLARLHDAVDELIASVEEQGRRLDVLIAAVEELSERENDDPSVVPFLSEDFRSREPCVDPNATDTSTAALPSPGLSLP